MNTCVHELVLESEEPGAEQVLLPLQGLHLLPQPSQRLQLPLQVHAPFNTNSFQQAST